MMKKFFYLSSTVILLLFLTLISCKGKFVLDPIDPRLPKYTENGNNVAGAMVNQDVWKSDLTIGFDRNYNEPFLKVYNSGDSLVLSLQGGTYKENNYLGLTNVEFHIRGLNIHTFSELKSLEGKTIQLDGVRNWGYYGPPIHVVNSAICSGTSGVGQIYFRYVSIKDTTSASIISGTFGFTENSSACGPIDISYGRFDFRFKTSANVQILP